MRFCMKVLGMAVVSLLTCCLYDLVLKPHFDDEVTVVHYDDVNNVVRPPWNGDYQYEFIGKRRGARESGGYGVCADPETTVLTEFDVGPRESGNITITWVHPYGGPTRMKSMEIHVHKFDPDGMTLN